MKRKFMLLICGTMLLSIATGCGQTKTDNKEKKEETVKSNCTIVECMKQIEPKNTVEEINEIIGFESTVDAMIGSDPIWKFDSKNRISINVYNDDTTIQATINKEDLKDDKITLPSSKELQQLLNKGTDYKKLVEVIGGEGTLTSKSNGSYNYTWVDKNGTRLGATFNAKSGKCSIASFR